MHTPAEAARLLGVRESWLRRAAGRRQIPSTLLGKHLRFSPENLRDIIASGNRSVRARTSGRSPR
ncbi:helix-turn-helix domain-containing protein [Actinoalloteichus hoggarensis]|uniref:helix-turn-helix domain-containing protein n=1 Tax=Actinoalloteichus hoggarensis TaxID=1470176 RepID=UPI000B8B69BC|nr:helix-turn-helix domain-containing protein [Actinoalloteichus hoggarensis]